MNTTARAQPGVATSAHLDIPIVPEEERLGFSVREFTRNWGLDARKGGGAHMWREIWNEDVSTIYKDILRESPGCICVLTSVHCLHLFREGRTEVRTTSQGRSLRGGQEGEKVYFLDCYTRSSRMHAIQPVNLFGQRKGRYPGRKQNITATQLASPIKILTSIIRCPIFASPSLNVSSSECLPRTRLRMSCLIGISRT